MQRINSRLNLISLCLCTGIASIFVGMICHSYSLQENKQFSYFIHRGKNEITAYEHGISDKPRKIKSLRRIESKLEDEYDQFLDAIAKKDPTRARILLNKVFNPNLIQYDHQYILIEAIGRVEASKRSHLIVKSLIDNGAKVNVLDSLGESPLWVASSCNHVEDVRLLLSHSAKIDSKDRNLESPLTAAARNGHTQIVKILLEHGANIETGYGYPLFQAALHGHLDIVKVLLKMGAKIEGSAGSLTPLMAAAEDGDSDVVKYLIAHGANVNARDENRDTALIRAKYFMHPEIVAILKKAGARH